MAFGTVQATLSLLSLFLFLNILTDNVAAAMSIREKCECVIETGSVPWRRITDFEMKMPDALCNKVQIIIKQGDQLFCLNPDSEQGNRLRNCWTRIKFNERKKKVCIQPKAKKRGRGRGRPKKQ
ncbi:chemokine (C-X-C motif) ligand 18a, duplicate 1 isoform X3 [Colossoma macropomum]|uniref:chemokine (C-X-C motif) ligand 18a, duplicate 1 isoform X2 n=1 Tax=Colossoma macropomum TaxID=42526 RepID=UPI001864155C|nr:chemokine (C-X-C motif) ligand 18a, duplicate 1 isoform X2 [Colossoma macropomum]XP_036430067.1 chemokine (C-X-C motif) ligand 18a, duplicate 1 isoform X3 [Colossoma macropomum]